MENTSLDKTCTSSIPTSTENYSNLNLETVITTNQVQEVVEKSSVSFKEALNINMKNDIIEGPGKSTFFLHKYLHDTGQFNTAEKDFPDNDTVNANAS